MFFVSPHGMAETWGVIMMLSMCVETTVHHHHCFICCYCSWSRWAGDFKCT